MFDLKLYMIAIDWILYMTQIQDWNPILAGGVALGEGDVMKEGPLCHKWNQVNQQALTAPF